MTRDTPSPDMAQIPERNSGPFAHPPRPTQRESYCSGFGYILIASFVVLAAISIAAIGQAAWLEYNGAVICYKEGC